MPLTEEIKMAATDLGLALNASPEMQELFELGAEPGQDPRYERQVEIVKALFTRTALRLSTTMGVKYTDFARS